MGECLQRFDKALQIQQSLGDRRGQRHHIARVYESSGDKKTALDYYERSLPPWQEADDRYGQAWTLFNMGRVFYLLKVPQKALDYQNRSLKLWQDLGAPAREAATLNSIGDTYVLLNDYKTALSTYEQARARWQAAGDLDGEVSTLFSISSLCSATRQKEQDFKTWRTIEANRNGIPILSQAKSDKTRGRATQEGNHFTTTY